MITFNCPGVDLYKKENIFSNLTIHSKEYVRSRSGWSFKRDFLGMYRLIFVEKGTLSFRVEEELFILKDGELAIINPFFTLDAGNNEKNTVEFFWINFTADKLSSVKGHAWAGVTKGNYALQGIMKILGDHIRNNCSQEHIEPLLVAAIYEKNRGLPESGLKDKVNIYLEEHISEYITAEDVAVSFNYSKDHLSRILSRDTGVSLKEYINRYKVERACMLLRTSALSVREIGEMVGYTDSNLFTKFFKYHMKVTPTEYKNGKFFAIQK